MGESGSSAGTGRPARSSELIEVCRRRIEGALLSWTPAAFENATEYLFQKAEKAASTELQNRMLAAINVLKKHQAEFQQALSKAVNSGFAIGLQASFGPAPDGEAADAELTLIDETELEPSLAASDMANKAELRYTQAIYALNKRMTVLNRGREVTSETNPLAPRQIGRAIHIASQCLDLESDYQVTLIQAFDRVVLKDLGDCYESLNEFLVENRILPNIKYEAKRAKERPRPPEEPSTTAAAPPRGEPVAGQAAPGGQPQRGAESTADRLTREVREESAEVIDQIKSLMSRVSRPPTTATAERPAAEAPLIDAALNDIQKELGGSRAELDSDSIRNRLDDALKAQKRGIGEEQSRTIELMGMIYEYISQEARAKPVEGLLERLRIPMLRVAVADEDFLENREHPARQFFNTIAEASDLWMDDTPEKSPTFEKIGSAVDTVLSDYEGNVDLFRGLADDLQKHIELQARRATVAEKRHVQARQGKERLMIARELAKRAIENLIERYRPPEFARSLLSGGWNDYMALLHLRHGEDSDAWKQALGTAKYLAVGLQGKVPGNLVDKLMSRLEPVKEQLSAGLGQVGYARQDIQDVLARVEEGIRWAVDQEREEPRPVEIETSAPVLRHAEPELEEETTPLASREPELSDEEKAHLSKLRLTAFGTWFEIQREEAGPWLKRKISWYSPVSGHCLLVNNHGQPEEMDLVDMARLLAAGRARKYETSEKPLLDRALGAVFSRLKRMAGMKEVPE